MERIINAFKQITPKNLMSPIIFATLFLPALLIKLHNKLKNKKLWLIAEEGDARDNGYYFFEYMNNKHKEIKCYYAISKKSKNYANFPYKDKSVSFGSIRHWLYYMSADLNISSQKSGNPDPIFWYIIHVIFSAYNNRVFLQHGVTINNVEWLHYEKTKFKSFITATKKEDEEIRKNFGYPDKSICLAGFSRWDKLKDDSDGKTILIMPTWRKYLGVKNNSIFNRTDFTHTDYYKKWNSLLNNKKLIRYIEKNNIKLCFYPHQNMQKLLSLFTTSSKNVSLLSMDNNISDAFNKSTLMITDYSSVLFDFAYLRKPAIYYQFDEDEYREKQYGKGHFDYRKDGFGPVITDETDLVDEIIDLMNTGIKQKYLKRIEKAFIFKHGNNSERIYNYLMKED